MNYIKNLSVKFKLASVLIMLLLSMGIVMLSVRIIIYQASTDYDRVYQGYLYNEKALNLLKNDIYGNKYSLLKAINNKKLTNIKQIEISDYFVSTDNQKYSLKSIRDGIKQYNYSQDKIIDLLKKSKYEEALNELNHMEKVSQLILKEENHLESINLKYSRQNSNKYTILYTKSNILIVVLNFVIIVIIFALIYFIFKDFYRQLEKISEISSSNFDSDLIENPYTAEGEDEFGHTIKKLPEFREDPDSKIKDILSKEDEMQKSESKNVNTGSVEELYKVIEEAYKGVNVMAFKSSVQAMKVSSQIRKLSDVSGKIKIFKKKSFASINNIKEVTNRLEDEFKDAIYEGQKIVNEINENEYRMLYILDNKDSNYVYKINRLFQILYEVEYIFFELREVLEKERSSFNNIEKIPDEVIDYSSTIQRDLEQVTDNIQEFGILINGQQVLMERLSIEFKKRHRV